MQNFDLAVCSLASGSRGNATYISDGNTAILIDAGLSGIELERRMISKGLSPENLNAIIVSHEHKDHIESAGILSRRYNLPIYTSSKTCKAIGTRLGKVFEYKAFECGSGFNINNLHIHPFSVSHDAKDTSGFTVSRNGSKMGIATDLGIVTTVVKEHLKGCQMLILEANHDIPMLMNGPYPWHLKQRVKGRTGHLSNEESGSLLKELAHEKLSHVILAHLSEKNNTPEKALNAVGMSMNGYKAKLLVARQDMPLDMVYIG
jgi:phosphoribosyl 1,2-cyclic phosphodiesterase